jgi:hypothetical protein
VFSRVRTWLRQLPGVPQARHAAEIAVAPYLRADLHELHNEVLAMGDRLDALEAHVRDLRTAVDDIERYFAPTLEAISATNGTARILRREVDDLRRALLAGAASDQP